MQQEVQITVTVSADARIDKLDIERKFHRRLQETALIKDGLTIMNDMVVKEEAEIYGNK